MPTNSQTTPGQTTEPVAIVDEQNTLAQGGGTDEKGLEQSDESDYVVDMFDQLANVDFDGAETVEQADDGGVQAPVSAPTEQVSAPSGEVPAPVEVTPQQPAPVAAPVAPVTTPAQTTDPNAVPVQGSQGDQQPAATEVPQESPIELFRREVEKNREVFTNALATSVYKLTQDEADAINTEPEVAVPMMMAKAHVNIVQNVLGTIAQQLPAAISGYMKAERVQAELEDKFFAKWPQLDRSADRAVVTQFAAAYRRDNPQASFEDMVRIVGSQAVVALNKMVPVNAAAPPAPKPVSAGGRAFAPAANGSRAPSVAPAPNIWEGVADSLIFDD